MDYIPGPHHKFIKNSEKFKSFVLERVKMHKESLDLSCPRDFIDAFLIKMEQVCEGSRPSPLLWSGLYISWVFITLYKTQRQTWSLPLGFTF